MKHNNKGLTLIELIIVIAIMAVLIGFVSFSVSLLFGTQAKGCAQKVSAMLSETQTGCLSRFDETMELSFMSKGADDAVLSDGYYTKNYVHTIDKSANRVVASDSEIRRMGGGRVTITVYLSDGDVFELGTSKSITVSYDRATGAFDPVVVDGTQTNAYIDKITFQSGLRTFTITMVAETGKHTLQG